MIDDNLNNGKKNIIIFWNNQKKKIWKILN